MTNYRFESYSDKYFASCVDLIMATWNLHSNFVDLPSRRFVYDFYLKTCLNWNHHLDLIVDNEGRVIGILLGSKEEISLIEELKFARRDRLNNKWKNKLLGLGRFGNKDVAKQELARFTMNDALGEVDACLFGGEVNLFIVSETYRGQGLGKQLMDRYLNFCRFNKVKSVFLWTDEDCNHGFYSRYGFSLHKRFSTYTHYRVKHRRKNGMIYSFRLQ
ncbi:N-acetyltransferase [Vibrio mediterranei]|uniref:N-acetyltransferase n=2 Tax=Vibrio mediterranei TaxID=689 RepID=A0A3G4VE57_9VIBR|nr:N-acetyltransferase [Vibrio mediterranei]